MFASRISRRKIIITPFTEVTPGAQQMCVTKEKNRYFECHTKVLCAGRKHFDKLKPKPGPSLAQNPARPEKPGPTYNSASATIVHETCPIISWINSSQIPEDRQDGEPVLALPNLCRWSAKKTSYCASKLSFKKVSLMLWTKFPSLPRKGSTREAKNLQLKQLCAIHFSSNLVHFASGQPNFRQSLSLLTEHARCGNTLFVRCAALVFRQEMDIFPVVKSDYRLFRIHSTWAHVGQNFDLTT